MKISRSTFARLWLVVPLVALTSIESRATDLLPEFTPVGEVDCLQRAKDVEAALASCQQNRPQVLTAVLRGEAMFSNNDSQLSEVSVASLKRLVSQLTQYPDIVGITVIGHTDSRGSEAYNLSLSTRRARFVGDILLSMLPNIPVDVIGVGESSPIADNATAEGRSRNRRVEINVVVNGAG